jgi:hypothetical protein
VELQLPVLQKQNKKNNFVVSLSARNLSAVTPDRVNVSAMETVTYLLHGSILIRCVLLDKKLFAEQSEKAPADNSAKRAFAVIQ